MTKHWHYAQYMHNKELAVKILRPVCPEYNDWSITSMFYSALHLINEYCVNHNKCPPKNHAERRAMVKDTLPQIRAEFDNLCDLSMNSRYRKSYHNMGDPHVQRAEFYLKKIEEHISSLP